MNMLVSNVSTLRTSLTAMLVGHAAMISALNRGGMYDWARNAESFFCEIAELLFKESFVLADSMKANHPIYDLQGENTVIQVTSQLGADKILNTLEAWNSKDRSHRLYFFLIGEKPKYKKNTLRKFRDLGFDPDDVWGSQEIINRCVRDGIDIMTAACAIARKHLLLDDTAEVTSKSELLQRIEDFLQEILSIKVVQEQVHREMRDRYCNESTIQYNRLMRLFNSEIDAISSCLKSLRTAVIEQGHTAHETARDGLHLLRFSFLQSKAHFESTVYGVKKSVKLKFTIDKIERLKTEKDEIELKLQECIKENDAIAREKASLEFEKLIFQSRN